MATAKAATNPVRVGQGFPARQTDTEMGGSVQVFSFKKTRFLGQGRLGTAVPTLRLVKRGQGKGTFLSPAQIPFLFGDRNVPAPVVPLGQAETKKHGTNSRSVFERLCVLCAWPRSDLELAAIFAGQPDGIATGGEGVLLRVPLDRRVVVVSLIEQVTRD